ncbi:MAG: HtaA domain-containing protein [Solirubrobacterales bacterium]
MFVAVFLWVPPVAGAADLEPCVPVDPGPDPVKPESIVEIGGEANLVASGKVKKTLERVGARQRLLVPASSSTGRPSFPVAAVHYGDSLSRVRAGGGLRLVGKGKRRIGFRSLTTVVKPDGRVFVNARFAGGNKRLFNVKKAKVRKRTSTGELYVQAGSARLSAAASRVLRKRFGIRKTNALKAGAVWGTLDLYALYRVTTPPADPEAETPEEPPVLNRPPGAVGLTTATIDWRVRDSFIRYVSSGDGANAVDGAVPGTPEGEPGDPQLVYSFSFPFSGGWSDAASATTVVNGTGGVHFRHCQNTINFVVSNPEVELNGDLSRLIFRVSGTDGTAFLDSRAVMVGLRLSQAESVQTVGKTTTYTRVPGFVPEGSAGIFADFYLPGAEFGSMTISVTTE